MQSRPTLIAGDVAAFVAFGLFGLASHEDAVTGTTIARAILPFPVAWLLIAPFFGAFEVMIPLSIIAMSVGMLAGMVSAQGGVPTECISVAGGMIGVTVSTIVYFSNKKLVCLK